MRQVQLAQKILFKLNFKSLFFFGGGGYLESQKRTKSPLMFIDTVDMIKTQGRFLASFFANKDRASEKNPEIGYNTHESAANKSSFPSDASCMIAYGAIFLPLSQTKHRVNQ